MVDSVVVLERQLFGRQGALKFSYETRGRITARVVSAAYAEAYHNVLQGMVERQLRNSVKTTGDLWYTAWVEAGQPDLSGLENYRPGPSEVEERRQEIARWKERYFKPRGHESDDQ